MEIFLVFAALVAAATAQSLSTLPPCVSGCVISTVQNFTTCGVDDFACQCLASNRELIESESTCTFSCSAQDQGAVQDFYNITCSDVYPYVPQNPPPTSDQIAAAAADYAAQPPCAQQCLNDTIAADGQCEVTDHSCQCNPYNIFRLSDASAACIANACPTAAEQTLIQNLLTAMCADIGEPLGGPSSSGATASASVIESASPTGNPNNSSVASFTSATLSVSSTEIVESETIISTITACPSWVTDCPSRSKSNSAIPITTTYRPVSTKSVYYNHTVGSTQTRPIGSSVPSSSLISSTTSPSPQPYINAASIKALNTSGVVFALFLAIIFTI
ncbi:hypothetical protein F5884DRAFT_882563 [Xylogone sp. PMI_703]|nr:hypothetical protein F5884DRAFT_882563 [Xylogone sp. PMI_703]